MIQSPSLFTRFCHILRGTKPTLGILMSGGGSNADIILQKRHLYPHLNFASIISDKSSSNAILLAQKHGIESMIYEGQINTATKRSKYFKQLGSLLKSKNITALIYAGFMKIATEDFVNTFPGINSHPADLRVLLPDGSRKYVGMEAVQLAIDDDCDEFRCSCCIVDRTVDEGQLIACSNPVYRTELTQQPIQATLLHEHMKQAAEWLYYPVVIQKISCGEISEHSSLPYMFTREELIHD